MPNNLIHTSLIWRALARSHPRNLTLSPHYSLYQQMSSRRWFSAQRKIDCTPASIRCLYNPIEYCKIHNTDSFVGLHTDIPFANISISGDGKKWTFTMQRFKYTPSLKAKILKLHCYAVINVLGIWEGRPSAARFLYLSFPRNYLYLFYLYIFPIRSGNVLINFLRTFAEAFYTQGFIYTKKLPKLTLASTCLCLHHRNVFLKKNLFLIMR